MKKKDNNLMIVIGAIILTVSVIVVTSIIDSNKKKIDQEIKIVTNYVEFYTVNSCLYRVITYISKNDTNSLLLTLNDEYKKKNNINSENILTFFPIVNANSTFVSKKMYYKRINSHLKKFYVYGQIVEEDMDTQKGFKDAFFIVYLDTDKKIFAIEPYDGKIFSGGEENE